MVADEIASLEELKNFDRQAVRPDRPAEPAYIPRGICEAFSANIDVEGLVTCGF